MPCDLQEAERRLGGYRIPPRAIVLLRTDAAKRCLENSYLTDHPGMTKEAVHCMLDRGVTMNGIDAIRRSQETHSRGVHGVMVRSEKWRYVEYGPQGANGAMLLDIQADPSEMHNLVEDPRHTQVRAKLSPLVRAYAANLGRTQA